MPSKDSLGDRMKNYENVNRNYLMRRTPTIIRIDGKAFHNFTRGMEKPFDNILVESMQETMQYLCANIQGCVFGYTQSDEISLLLIDYQNLNSNAWFDYNIQKMTSISASMATLAFDRAYRDLIAERKDIPVSYDFMSTEKQKQYDNRYNIYNKRIGTAMFDSRVFNIPKEEVCNYFIWRQQDATKNAISMVARAYFSHKSLEGLNGNQKQEKLWQEKGINFNDFPVYLKRGSGCYKFLYSINEGTEQEAIRSIWKIDDSIPIFTQDRDYIEKFIERGCESNN